ncbi:MAG TPA: MFS transporter [Terracidiphilus sp.]|jgi:MFS family permease
MRDQTEKGRELRKIAPALTLLVIAVLINYVDRGNLALAAPLLKVEWHLSASQLGILFSSFFWSYMLLQFVVGWLVDRFSVTLVMALGFLVWSLSTAATGLVTGFITLLIMRLLLGVGESVMFPASSKICAQHLPERSRGFANALIMASIRWGSALGTFGGGLLMARYGWRATFIIIGLVSLLWLPAWQYWQPKKVDVPAVGRVREKPNVGAILRRRSFWGTSTGHFCGNYLLYFLISWLPYYLVQERHLSMANMAGTAGLLYAIDSFSAVITGWVADRNIGKGRDPVVVRKSAMAVGFAIAAVSLMACAVAGPHTYFWCLLATGIGSGTASSGPFAMGQTLAGPQAAGRWIGLQNGVANLSGVTGPALTGFLVDQTGHFGIALAVAALVAVVGALAWLFVVKRPTAAQWLEMEETFA